MDDRQEVREFLMTRRARITPEQVGLPAGRGRRVPGLRRSEVATIAGLSVEYYARLERGQIAGASAGVLDTLARALRLDDTERAHLLDLARAATRTTAGCRTSWASCPPAARSSDASGAPTTCAPMAPAPSASTTLSSAS